MIICFCFKKYCQRLPRSNFMLFCIFKYFIYESKYVQQLIFKGSSSFMEDQSSYTTFALYIYRKQLELKLEHQGEHATFLDLDITVEDNIFAYKPFEKGISFRSLLCVCLISRAIFRHQYSMVQCFQSSYE